MSGHSRVRALLFGALTISTGALMAASSGDDVTVSEVEVEPGRELYDRCLACHAIEYDRVGPRHCDLFGRRAGSVSGFPYSTAMRQSGIVWESRTLDAFLRDPPGYVPGTTMTYAGVPNRDERLALISWLQKATAAERCRIAPRARKQ